MITTMKGNKYVILFLCGAAEIPSNVISAFIFQRYIPTMSVAWLSFYLWGVGLTIVPVVGTCWKDLPNIIT